MGASDLLKCSHLIISDTFYIIVQMQASRRLMLLGYHILSLNLMKFDAIYMLKLSFFWAPPSEVALPSKKVDRWSWVIMV